MFGLWTRPVRRRPRTVPAWARTSLRLESLEARANPAAPVLAGVGVKWLDTNVVYIAGTIQDAQPGTALVHLTGSVEQVVEPAADGQFSMFVKIGGAGPIYVQATDNVGLSSGTAAIQYGQPVTTLGSDRVTLAAPGQPVLGDVTISQDANGQWHIRGHVDNVSPIGTVIKIINAPDGTTAESGAVNEDGSFDIVINVNGGGGAISIIAISGDGTQSDAWDGTIF